MRNDAGLRGNATRIPHLIRVCVGARGSTLGDVFVNRGSVGRPYNFEFIVKASVKEHVRACARKSCPSSLTVAGIPQLNISLIAIGCPMRPSAGVAGGPITIVGI